MNLQEAYDTSHWLLTLAYVEDLEPIQILRVRQMRDVLFYLHTAAGISEIRIQAFEQGREEGLGGG